MADEVQYVSRTDNKRKFDDPPAAVPARRATGFSAPIASDSPENKPSAAAPAPPSYSSVPPPVDGIELAKQRAQEIAARLFSDAEAKRPKLENGGAADDSTGTGFSSGFSDHSQKPFSQPLTSQVGTAPPSSFVAYGYQGSSKKMEIPNGRVGVIIGKGGDTIRYLQLQSGAKIQVTRDMDADPYSQSRPVELVGTPEQISKAEQLINDVLAEAETAGGSGATRKLGGQVGAEQFVMKVANNKVGLIIGKGGETIKGMQAKSGARIQLIPLHPPPGDTSTERTVQIDGTSEQIELAKQLISEVTSESRVRNPQMSGGYTQQGYRPPRPPTSWGGPPQGQQPGYGYMQPGVYPGAPPPYSMPQQPYGGWDQSSSANPPAQQTTPGYDYYNQQQQPPAVGESDSTNYNYGQQAQGSYPDSQQQGYGYYNQQGYNVGSNPTAQDGSTQSTPGGQQAPPPAPAQPSAAPQVYGVPPTSQPGYGSQAGYGYGQGQAQQQTVGYAQGQPAYIQPGYGGPQPGYEQYSQPGYGGYSQAPDNSAAQAAVTKASPQS